MEESGYRVDAVDLAGSGIHTFDTNSITSLAQYVKPLTDMLKKLGDGEKVFCSLSLWIYARIIMWNYSALLIFDIHICL